MNKCTSYIETYLRAGYLLWVIPFYLVARLFCNLQIVHYKQVSQLLHGSLNEGAGSPLTNSYQNLPMLYEIYKLAVDWAISGDKNGCMDKLAFFFTCLLNSEEWVFYSTSTHQYFINSEPRSIESQGYRVKLPLS